MLLHMTQVKWKFGKKKKKTLIKGKNQLFLPIKPEFIAIAPAH